MSQTPPEGYPTQHAASQPPPPGGTVPPAPPVPPGAPTAQPGVPPVPPGVPAAPYAAPLPPQPQGPYPPIAPPPQPPTWRSPGAAEDDPAPAAPYVFPAASQPQVTPVYAQEPAPPAPATLGMVAFALALLAAVGATLLAAGAALAAIAVVGDDLRAATAFDVRLLSPVKGEAILVEIAFWSGTALGIWAIVQGWIAAARRRGRGFGVAAIVIAALGPVVFLSTVVVIVAVGG